MTIAVAVTVTVGVIVVGRRIEFNLCAAFKDLNAVPYRGYPHFIQNLFCEFR